MGRPSKEPDPPQHADNLPIIDEMIGQLRELVYDGREEIFWHLALRKVLQELDRRRGVNRCPTRPIRDLGSALGEKE